jgi:hypothetical protein
MLTINVTMEGDKVILNGLRELADDLPDAVERGLARAAVGIHRAAFDWLSGPGAKASNIAAGGYPVPIRTGHLRRMLDWLKPGASKPGMSAGPMEAIVYNSAEYAKVIHEGTGSSAKFGARPFITDGFNRFNQGNKIARIIDKEIELEIKRKGLG